MLRYSEAKFKSDVLFESQRGDSLIVLLLREKKKTLTIKLVRSFAHRLDSQIATCKSLGLKKIGDVTVQPDNACTRGKLAKVAHMVEVTE